MAKKYLCPGMKLRLTGGYATVGLSCSVIDLNIDWTATEEYCGDAGIGDVVILKYTYAVYRDPVNGKLFYNDEFGY